MLAPKASKTFYWIVKDEGALQDNYQYTFPIEVTSSREAKGLGSFSSSTRSPLFSLQDIGSILDQKEEETLCIEAAIDCLVYLLYNLTAEKIDMIEKACVAFECADTIILLHIVKNKEYTLFMRWL